MHCALIWLVRTLKVFVSTALSVELGISNLNITKNLRLPKTQSLDLVLDYRCPSLSDSFHPSLTVQEETFLLFPCHSTQEPGMYWELRWAVTIALSTHLPVTSQGNPNTSTSVTALALCSTEMRHCWLITPLGRLSTDKQSRVGFPAFSPAAFARAQGTLPGKIWRSVRRDCI